MPQISLLFSFHFMNGNLVDAIEYYIFLRQKLGKGVQLLFLNPGRKFDMSIIQGILCDRYVGIDVSDLSKGISVVWDFTKLSRLQGKVICLNYSTVCFASVHFREPEKTLVFSNFDKEKASHLPRLKHMTVFGEMPFHYSNHKYRFRFLFDQYKPIPEPDDKTLLIWMRDDLVSPHDDVILRRAIDGKLISTDLLSKFSALQYVGGDVFDNKPRLPVESAFYKRPWLFVPGQHEDGAYYRFRELEEKQGDVSDRNFRDDDEVLLWCKEK